MWKTHRITPHIPHQSKRKVSNSRQSSSNVARYMECLCACRIEQNMHHVHGTVRYNSIVDLATFPRQDWIWPQEHKLYNSSGQPRVQKKCVGTDSKPVMLVRHLSWLLVVAATCFLTSCQISPMTLPGHIVSNLFHRLLRLDQFLYCTKKNVFHCPCWHTYVIVFVFLGLFFIIQKNNNSWLWTRTDDDLASLISKVWKNPTNQVKLIGGTATLKTLNTNAYVGCLLVTSSTQIWIMRYSMGRLDLDFMQPLDRVNPT